MRSLKKEKICNKFYTTYLLVSGKSRFDLSEYIKLTEQYSFIKFEFGFGFEKFKFIHKKSTSFKFIGITH